MKNIILQHWNGTKTFWVAKCENSIKKYANDIDADYEQARNTTCIIPLYPEGDEYMPCDFVDRSGEMIESIGWKEHGFMMTTRKLHRVISNKYDRLNLQITFKEPIEELYELYKEDKLIRKQ